MSILNIHNKQAVLPNYTFKDRYWPLLTSLIYEEVRNSVIKKPAKVEELLKKCFTKLCGILEVKIKSEKRASFYIFCKNLHEDSIELWLLQTQNKSLGINEEDFAVSRRILKIILEQSTKLELKGCLNFENEINSNIEFYTQFLEELLYIGTWCYTLSEYIARSQLFPYSTGIKIEDNELNVLTFQPYPELFSYIFHELPKHNSNIVLSDSIIEFKEIINDNYGVTYDDLSQFINQQIIQPEYRFGISKLDDLINEITKEINCNAGFVRDFYSGLTVDKLNCLPIENCFYNNQDENRHIFRPILELSIDGKTYNIIGHHKWLESMTLLTTNSFPFGLFPNEWKKHKQLKSFIHKIDNTHDKLLENPITKILNDKGFLNDSNLESFKKPNGININIKQDVGDIDILFIDQEYKLIYVCECKHNRSRFDMNNWKRDYKNFKDKYENQLTRKIDWANSNKGTIQTHFKCTKNINIDLSEYNVRGIFIINAPTVYMFNGTFRAFTIKDVIDLVNREYVDVKFEFTNEETKEKTIIEYPYFDNVRLKFE